jgi:16S rRNA (adenine1518-N6/adenine1519-N6)-dimethyltransferase
VVHKKKKYGQHFLTDKNIASKITASLTNPDSGIVIEIGPGEGILTGFLINKYSQQLYIVEIDTELIPILHEKYPVLKDRILHIDFLELNLNDFDESKISVIGNFPYNISSQILFRIIEFREKVTELVGMFQKEVAKRICSEPGSKDYGILSVLIQAYYHTQYLFSVSHKVFSPPPNVESGVIRLQRKENFRLDCNESLFQRIVKQAFQQRRKTLRNSLKSIINDPRYLSTDTHVIFNNRPEDLSFIDFVFITNLINLPNEQ